MRNRLPARRQVLHGEVVEPDVVAHPVAPRRSSGVVAPSERVIREVVVIREQPPVFYQQQAPPAPPVSRPSPWLRVGYAIGLAAAVIATIWALSLAGREPSTTTRPPWRQGSDFNVGPHLDGSRQQQRPEHSSRQDSR